MTENYYSLYGRLLSVKALYKGFVKVKQAKGAAGIDGQNLSDFARNLRGNLETLLHELQTKTYRPLPVRRVEIPKDDGGVRLLGIPAVRDRIVQQALADILNPIFDPDFHPSSYGYRPNRSCHQAISKATMFIRQYGRKHVVDMDLSRCFDCLDHEIIIASVQRKIKDGSILNLIRQFLKCGVMTEGGWQASTSGSPQGGVISPLFANIYLDAFDQAMRKRNHRIVRYADDILILCASRTAADNALHVATQILERDLKLTVNETKTHIAHSSRGVKFLGVVIGSRITRIQDGKLKSFKQKVKQLTKRNGGKPLSEVIARLNPLLRGFSHYFAIANCNRHFKSLAGCVRRRLRSVQLRLWKKPSRLHRWLRQHGYQPPFKHVSMSKWRTSLSPLANYAMPNKWFDDQGLFSLEQVRTGVLSPI